MLERRNETDVGAAIDVAVRERDDDDGDDDDGEIRAEKAP